MRSDRRIGAFVEIAFHSAFADSEIRAVKSGDEIAGNYNLIAPGGFAVFLDAHRHNNRFKVSQFFDKAAIFSDLADLRKINAVWVYLKIHISCIALNGSDEKFKTAVRINGVITLRAFAAKVFFE